MYTADLIARVLPLATAPDFRDERERVAPKYDKELYEANVEDYKLYNMIKAQLHFHDEVELLNGSELLDQIALGLMYHPRFPDTFFNYIANKVKGIPLLPPDGVEAFLEGNYGAGLQQPDCDYLFLILKTWESHNTVLRFNNLHKAIAWIKNKRVQLPQWPNSIDAEISVVQPPDNIADNYLLFSQIEILKTTFFALGLLDGSGKFRTSVRPGHVAGIIRYLIDKRSFNGKPTPIFHAIKSEFGYKNSLKSIQDYNNLLGPNIMYFAITENYFTELDNKC